MQACESVRVTDACEPVPNETDIVSSATPRTAAFFDLDGTLIPGSANIPLAKAAFRRGFVTPRELARDLRNGLSFLLQGATDERSAEVRDRILRAVAGHRAAEVEALGDDFLTALIGSLRPAMRDVLDEHRRAGHERIVLSASPTEIVSRFAREAGLDHGRGTAAERDAEGVYTGRLAGPFCYREGKADVMSELARERGYDLAASYAYSDSVSDLPMLRAVGHPVAVNPEPELREVAKTSGWPVLEISSVPRESLTSARGMVRLALNLMTAAARQPLSGRA